jgi:transcription elongation GreA/GreB family factor
MEPPEDDGRVHFGSCVTLLRADGRKQSFRIVGEDEAAPTHGTVSHAAPLARAVLGREKGEVVEIQGSEAEITDVWTTA